MTSPRFHAIKRISPRKGLGPVRRLELRKRIAVHQQLRAELERAAREGRA